MTHEQAGASAGGQPSRYHDSDGQPELVEAIETVGRLLTGGSDLSSVAQSLVDTATRLMGAETGVLVYISSQEDGALSRAVTGARAEQEAPLTAFPVRNLVRESNLRGDPAYAAGAPGMPPGVRTASYIASPLLARDGRQLGAICFGHAEPDRFSHRHERLLRGVAQLAAATLDNARLNAALGERAITDARLAAIVQSSDDAIVSKDLSGIVKSWNAGAERMFGYRPDEMIGRPITVLFPSDRLDEEERILARLREGERVDHFETARRTKDGRLIDVSVTISPIRDATGTIIGASKVARDITERKRLEAEQERLLASERSARSDAELHSRMKDEFLATLGHELRTPLNAILGWCHLLRKSSGGVDIAQGLSVIDRNARLQARLIEDLLDMSRIVAGKLRLEMQPVDLAAVVLASLESVRPAAEAKGVRLQQTIDDTGTVSGDPNRLQQVVWNLLSNAVKFTPKGGRVQMVVERIDSRMRLTVRDTGEGIDPAFLPMVFDRFRQEDASTTRRHGGLGLGLAIVRHLVELHGGTVGAASEGQGRGAAFTVELPVRAATQSASDHRHAAGGQIKPVSLTGLRVLVVDDEADSRDLLTQVLSTADATVTAASNAEDAISLLRSSVPDVIVSDIGMPGVDGYTMLRKVRALPAHAGGRVPAIALTAYARAEDRRQALLAGFHMHVPKPVDPAELVAAIASITHRV